MGKRVLAEEQNNNQRYTGGNQSHPMGFNNNSNRGFLYGWRKYCLFFIVFLLVILIAINLALTLWILKALEVTQNGMGRIKIVDKGLELDGTAILMDKMKTSHIKARSGQPLTFESAKNLTFNIRDGDGGEIQNQMFVGHDRFEVTAKKFQVNDAQGNVLMNVDKSLIEFSAGALRVEGDGGVIFSESVQTPILKSEPGKDLKLESPTRSLNIIAAEDLNIQSHSGSIEGSSLNDIILTSNNGAIRLNAGKILFSNLDQFNQGNEKSSNEQPTLNYKVYQLCICDTGNIFLAASHSPCAGDLAIVCST